MDADTSKTEHLAERAYAFITDTIMPEETLISMPVPLRRDSLLIAAFFGAVSAPLADLSNCEIYRPMVRIQVHWEDGRVLGHEIYPDVHPHESDEPVGLHYAESVDAEENPQQGLYELLDRVGPLYDRQNLTSAERELLGHWLLRHKRT